MQIFNLKINDGNNLSGSQTEKNQECAKREYAKGIKTWESTTAFETRRLRCFMTAHKKHTNDIKSHATRHGLNLKHICSMYAFEQLK